MGITAIVIDSVLLSLATIAISIRLYSKKLQRQSLLLNDYAAMLAWVRILTQHHMSRRLTVQILAASLVIASNMGKFPSFLGLLSDRQKK